MTFMSCIGKLFGDGGLLLALTESGIYAESSAKQMIQGKHLDRGVRGIKIIHEAFYRLPITSATEWYGEKGENLMHDATLELLDELATAYISRNEEDATKIAKEILPQVQEIEEKIQAFRNLGRQDSNTFIGKSRQDKH